MNVGAMDSALWATVHGPEGQYYWDLVGGKTARVKPDNLSKWNVAPTPPNKWYYWDSETKTTTRNKADVLHYNAVEVEFPSVSPGHSEWPDNLFQFYHHGKGMPREGLDTIDGGILRNCPHDKWVEIGNTAEKYYWNYGSDVTAAGLIKGSVATWHGVEVKSSTGRGDDDPDCYYHKVGSKETYWTIPSDDAVAERVRVVLDTHSQSFQHAPSCDNDISLRSFDLELGMALRLTGLIDDRFNGQVGEVVDFRRDRVGLKLPEPLGAPIVWVVVENLKPLDVGDIVRLRGLNNESTNGFIGTVTGCQTQCRDPSRPVKDCRYVVAVTTSDQELFKSVRFNKVAPYSRLWKIDMRGESESLVWKSEQSCIFVDSKGLHRKYYLQLPLSFITQNRKAGMNGISRKWPLLIYLHGSGGGTLFTHSKKSLSTEGLQYAAKKFVVVSPFCGWQWKDDPDTWILDLVQQFRAASWIDTDRIYLTGCSMGGMSTWQLAYLRPWYFAAIAPVAAHHHAKNEDEIAAKLADTPIVALQSKNDETCPIVAEKPLWQKVALNGNNCLNVSLASWDHVSMFERAYCSSTKLYEMLLLFSKKKNQ